MSRKRFFSAGPRPGRTYRLRLEVFEDRLALSSVVGSPPALMDASALVGESTCQAAAFALSAAAQANEHAATQSTSPVVETAPPNVVRGSSTLIRTDHGVSIRVKTSGLLPGAYTAWWAVFNTPGQGPPTAGYATGLVVGENGEATFAAHLNEGETLVGHPLSGGSLLDARTAEIHFVIRYHGPVQPGHVFEQTHTFQPELDSDNDPNTRNVQVTIHNPLA